MVSISPERAALSWFEVPQFCVNPEMMTCNPRGSREAWSVVVDAGGHTWTLSTISGTRSSHPAPADTERKARTIFQAAGHFSGRLNAYQSCRAISVPSVPTKRAARTPSTPASKRITISCFCPQRVSGVPSGIA